MLAIWNWTWVNWNILWGTINRGAELIEELMQKQIRQQEEEEKDVLEKIKMKMDRIKATHHRRQKGPQNHFDGMYINRMITTI